MHAEERQHECSQRRSEVRAGRLNSRFRLRAYRTVQTRLVSSRSVHHGIFPDFYFYTHSLQRPHERRPMASRREQVSALFFVAWTQRRLTECFPWATEGPNPPKETLTSKKIFFGKQRRDHYPRALKSRGIEQWGSVFKKKRKRKSASPSGVILEAGRVGVSGLCIAAERLPDLQMSIQTKQPHDLQNWHRNQTGIHLIVFLLLSSRLNSKRKRKRLLN